MCLKAFSIPVQTTYSHCESVRCLFCVLFSHRSHKPQHGDVVGLSSQRRAEGASASLQSRIESSFILAPSGIDGWIVSDFCGTIEVVGSGGGHRALRSVGRKQAERGEYIGRRRKERVPKKHPP